MLRRGGPRTQPLAHFCYFSSSVQCSVAIVASHLRRCARSKALHEGLAFHHHMVKQNLHRNPYLLNLLLHVYAECAAFNDSNVLFSVCPRDVFSYNFMIGAYARAIDRIKVLHLFCRLHVEAVLPDRVTYASVVSTLASLSLLNVGRFLHACILHFMHLSVATAIIHMYGECGSLHDAQMTFQHMHERDVVAWNCIIGVDVDCNMGKDAFFLYDRMETEGIVPDKVTFISLLSACSNTLELHAGMCVHTDIVSRGFEKDTVVGNALVGMYAKVSNLDAAQLVFEKMPVHNVVSWNTIIRAYSQEYGGFETLNLFNEMQNEGVEPNRITLLNVICTCSPPDALRLFDAVKDDDVVLWNALISSFCMLKQHTTVIQLFHQMQLEGVMPNKVTLISMVSVCSSEQGISLGQRIHSVVVGNGGEHDTLSNALMSMYYNCYSMEYAESIFHSMVSRTVVTWTIMVSVLSWNKRYAEAVQCFDRMLLEGLVPDKFVYASALDACVNLMGLTEGKRFHARVLAMKFYMDVVLGTALLSMYGECGNFRAATIIFNGLCEQNTVSYNAFIAVCAHHGQAHRVLELFQQMHAKSFALDSSTLLGLLNGCSHCGLLEEGIHYFSAMENNYDVLPSVEHHACIVDLFGRAGQVMEADCLINAIHVNHKAISYRTLLGACWKSADLVFARRAASEAFILYPEDDGFYFLL